MTSALMLESEVADHLRVSPKTVARLRAAGQQRPVISDHLFKIHAGRCSCGVPGSVEEEMMTEPKTVTVRIAVAIDPYGCWCAAGHSGMDDDIKIDHARDGVAVGEAVYWITATLPLEIAGTVEAAGDA